MNELRHFPLHGTSSLALGLFSFTVGFRHMEEDLAWDINSGQALLAQVKYKTGGRQQVKREPQAGCDNA